MGYASREQRKRQIVSTLYREWQQGRWMTTHEIAKAIGIKPSAHLRGIIAELIVQGYVSVKAVPHRPHITKLMHTINKRQVQIFDMPTWELLSEVYQPLERLFL